MSASPLAPTLPVPDPLPQPAALPPAALPPVDEGELHGGVRAFLQELRPRPGRLADTIRLVLLVLASVTISEVFRLPEAAVSAYVILFVSRSERASTVKTAAVAGVAVILAVFITIAVFMASLSEPALRLPLIALITAAAMFFSRISPLGPAAFAAGFIIAYGLTIGDQVLGLSLQSAGVSNTTEIGPPELLSIPPEEALLQFVLWLIVVIAMPVALVIVANLLTGRQPILLLRTALSERLSACARFCAGEPGAERALVTSAREGTTGMVGLLKLAGAAPPGGPDYATLVRETEQLAFALLAWPLVATAEERQRALLPCTAGLRAAERLVREGTVAVLPAPAPPAAMNAAAAPLAAEVARTQAAIASGLSPEKIASGPSPDKIASGPSPDKIATKPSPDKIATKPSPDGAPLPAAPKEAGHLISAAAARNPETLRFALKVALAVMISYAAESLLDWPAIHTCVVTCFFVSLGTIGESLHKAALRITGALIGGALGIGTILLLMPVMTDLGDLLLALAAVTALAGWIACGSERISYAGWQIGIAYYLTVLQGYGPTLDMQTARDRVIGIVLGNIIVLVVFTTLWPVSLAQPVRRQVAVALEQLGKLVGLQQLTAEEAAATRPGLQIGFGAATNGARALLANTAYEAATLARPNPRPIDTDTIAELEGLFVVVSVILNLRSDPVWTAAPEAARQAVSNYHREMANWFKRCAEWVRTGAGGQTIDASLPRPPALETPDLAAPAAWYGLLDSDIRTVLGRVLRSTDGRADEALAHG
jgi:multidrug resistance protein MdtO